MNAPADAFVRTALTEGLGIENVRARRDFDARDSCGQVWNRAQKNQAQDEQAIDCNHARQVSTTGDGHPDENPGLGFA
jgi:hypothetical protein